MGGDAVSPTEAGAILGRALNSQKEHKKAMDPRSIFSDWIEWGCSWGWPSKALLCRFPGLGLQALEPRRLWWDLQWQTSPILCSLTRPCLHHKAGGRWSHPHPIPLPIHILMMYCHLHAAVCHTSCHCAAKQICKIIPTKNVSVWLGFLLDPKAM